MKNDESEAARTRSSRYDCVICDTRFFISRGANSWLVSAALFFGEIVLWSRSNEIKQSAEIKVNRNRQRGGRLVRKKEIGGRQYLINCANDRSRKY